MENRKSASFSDYSVCTVYRKERGKIYDKDGLCRSSLQS